MAVRTKKLVVATTAPANAEHTIYTAPAGETVIVKDIRVSVISGTPGRFVVWVQSGAARTSLMDRALAALDAPSLVCWVVLSPGDTIGCYTNVGVAIVWVSGAELEGLAD